MTIHDIYAPVSGYFRRRRTRWLQEELKLSAQDSLLDVGGYPWCWPDSTNRPRLTLFNQAFPENLAKQHPEFVFSTGDGCNLPYANQEFDVIYSNSVIEHVGTWDRQQEFAKEARRTAGRLWIQTPAREFFIEPHLIAPFIHWLPRHWQRRLIRNFTVRGWLERPDKGKVDAFLDEVRLLTFAEMKHLFPDCTILREQFLGMTKSYIAVRHNP